MAWYCWLATLCTLGLIIFVFGVMDLFTIKPDFDIDDYEIDSGVINVKANNKAQSDIDADKLLDNDGA